jgi:hypothetical protein
MRCSPVLEYSQLLVVVKIYLYIEDVPVIATILFSVADLFIANLISPSTYICC